MQNFITRSAAVASLAIAALPFIALGAAHAQTASVQISDLNTSRPAQVQEFNNRVDQAADQFCAGYTDPRNLNGVAACKSGVRAELQEKVAAAQLSADQAKLGALTVASR